MDYFTDIINKKNIFNYNKYNINNSNNTINANNNGIYNLNKKFISKHNQNHIDEENFTKIYTNKQKAKLDMVRGCYIYDKKYFNFDIRNGNNTINYIKFIKLTEPIININYRKMDKFHPLINNKFLNEISKAQINKNKALRKYPTFINYNNSKLLEEFCLQE